MVTEKIFESRPGHQLPWFIAGMASEPSQKKLNICVDFEVGSRFGSLARTGSTRCTTP
ncbi:MAG: hypothetical protein U1F35_07855 [Steroidobacteraceae bacterium]